MPSDRAPPFELVNHTADLAIRARGRTFPELVLHAARGLCSLLADAGRLEPQGPSRRVEAAGDTRERLLVGCLREVLALETLDGLVPVRVEPVSGDDSRIVLDVATVPLDKARDYLLADIKAVTYHDLQVRETPQGLEATIVFDT